MGGCPRWAGRWAARVESASPPATPSGAGAPPRASSSRAWHPDHERNGCAPLGAGRPGDVDRPWDTPAAQPPGPVLPSAKNTSTGSPYSRLQPSPHPSEALPDFLHPVCPHTPQQTASSSSPGSQDVLAGLTLRLQAGPHVGPQHHS